MRALALVLAAWTAPAAAGGPGAAGGEFLGIAASTRAAGMGEAYAGVADDAGALAVNPAGLVRSRDLSIHYLHALWLAELGYDYLAAVVPVGSLGTAGASFTRLYAEGDRVGIGPAGEPVPGGRFDASQSAVTLGFARSFGHTLSAGMALKAVSEDLEVSRGSGLAADFGLLYRTPLPQLTTGAAVANVGSGLAGAPLPVTLRLGAAYAFPPRKGLLAGAKADRWDVPLAALDLLIPVAPTQPSFIRLRLGGEYALAIGRERFVAVRLGYRLGEEGAGNLQGVAVGLGYRSTMGRFRLGVDYALGHYGELGAAHRLAFTTTFLSLSEVSFEVDDAARASRREGQVYLQWPPSSDPQVSGYNVYMGETPDADFVKVNRAGPVSGTTLSLRGLKIGQTYYFFVTPVTGVEPAVEGRPFFETSAVAQPVP